jgi:hypothetical protein
MTRKITAGMQDINDDDHVRLIQKYQEMLPCPREPQIGRIINQNRTASAMRLTVQDCLTAGEHLVLIEFSLFEPEFFDRPFGNFDQACLCAPGQPKGSVHEDARAFAKARRIASSPLPSAQSPAFAWANPSNKPCRIPASWDSSCSNSRSPARIASLTF